MTAKISFHISPRHKCNILSKNLGLLPGSFAHVSSSLPDICRFASSFTGLVAYDFIVPSFLLINIFLKPTKEEKEERKEKEEDEEEEEEQETVTANIP